MGRRLMLGVLALAIVLVGMPLGALRADAAGSVSLTATGAAYAQNFDTLASAGTSSTTPEDWAVSETGANANALYSAGTGSGNAGDTYSFGSAASAERAFGGLQSGSLIPTVVPILRP